MTRGYSGIFVAGHEPDFVNIRTDDDSGIEFVELYEYVKCLWSTVVQIFITLVFKRLNTYKAD